MLALKNIFTEKNYRFESPLEERVIRRLLELNLPIRFESQFEVKPYRIDIAFVDSKVGLELDGKDYHDPIKDKLRDEYLETVEGWKIERVPGWFVYRNPDITILKAIRHIDSVKETPQYKNLKAQADLWHYKELKNDGFDQEADDYIQRITQ